ncbi:hypothetical protein BDW22DRAFT_1359005 [Trametopsis cervina]|nr:hypothetical protein BDW22DRAFT_1359005 [Trametopsis cervina]
MTTVLSSPSTPSSRRSYTHFGHTPTKSSPLSSVADSSPIPSPTSAAQERRRSQYKNVALSSPTIDRTRAASRTHTTSTTPRHTPARFELSGQPEETPGKTFLRERFKARCLERAARDRERKIAGKRRASDWSSDGPDEVMDWEDEDEDVMILNDAFFSRIMASVRHQKQHSYRLSYAQEVGSSFDPDLEDVTTWEDELQETTADDIPDELDDDEVAAYAAEQELLEGLNAEDIFSYSDVDDYPPVDDDGEEFSHGVASSGTQSSTTFRDMDVEMDL